MVKDKAWEESSPTIAPPKTSRRRGTGEEAERTLREGKSQLVRYEDASFVVDLDTQNCTL